MVHGELDDPGLEFFVQAKESRLSSGGSSSGGEAVDPHSSEGALLDHVMRKLHQAKATTGDMFGGTSATQESKNFDWTTSYTLSLDRIPGSHVSPRIAGKVLFAGKAVKLLQSSGLLATDAKVGSKGKEPRVNVESLGYSSSEAYKYLSSGNSFETVDSAAEEKDTESVAPPKNAPSDRVEPQGTDPQVRAAYQEFVESGGYSVEDTVLFTEQFSSILRHPDQAVELLEAAVEAINDTISNRLWALLRDSYGFLPFLQVIRSTYLLGRGELFQSLLDGVLALTLAPTPAGLEMDNILNWKVLRTSAKLVGLENDDSLNELVKLRVNNADVAVRNFALHKPDLQLIGAAVELSALSHDHSSSAHAKPASRTEEVRAGQRTLVELCRPAASSSYEQFQRVWSHFLRKKVVTGDSKKRASHTGPASMRTTYTEGNENDDISDLDDDFIDGESRADHRSLRAGDEEEFSQAGQRKRQVLKYCPGAIRFVDQKFVSRGFTLGASFACSWNDLRSQLTSQHPFFKGGDLGAESDSADYAEGRVTFPPPGCGAAVVALGSVACCLRGDRKSSTQGHSSSVGTLSIGVKFYGASIYNRQVSCFLSHRTILAIVQFSFDAARCEWCAVFCSVVPPHWCCPGRRKRHKPRVLYHVC